MLKSQARHAAISTLLDKPFYFEDKPLIVHYEVNFQEGQECGGAYLKLLTLDEEHKDLKQFHDKTPYTIMFGPDKCGNDHSVLFDTCLFFFSCFHFFDSDVLWFDNVRFFLSFILYSDTKIR